MCRTEYIQYTCTCIVVYCRYIHVHVHVYTYYTCTIHVHVGMYRWKIFRVLVKIQHFMEKYFADCQLKIWPGPYVKNLQEKTSTRGGNTGKFTKVFTHESFQLYGIYNVHVHVHVYTYMYMYMYMYTCKCTQVDVHVRTTYHCTRRVV